MPQCTKDEFCVAMDKYCDVDDNYRGIHSLVPFDLETGMPSDSLYIYYRNKKADKGIVFNFCPWCGADLKAFQKGGKP